MTLNESEVSKIKLSLTKKYILRLIEMSYRLLHHGKKIHKTSSHTVPIFIHLHEQY